jgi:hypothetical protein
MKTTTLIHTASAILLLSSFSVDAQTPAKTYPEPEFKDTPYYFDESKNELVNMQSASFTQDTRTSGFSSEEEFYYTEGEKAAVRIKKNAKMIFVTKWTSPDRDPTDYYQLMKLKYNPKKKRREVVMEQKSTYNNSKNAADVMIFFKTKDGQDIWDPEDKSYPKYYIRTFVVENLEPGEYVWKYGLRESLFFGVDE